MTRNEQIANVNSLMYISVMNSIIPLSTGSPAVGGMPNLGPWAHFLWVLVILGLILFVIWWAWRSIGGRVPEPLHTIIFVLLILLTAIAIIMFVLMPLMSVF